MDKAAHNKRSRLENESFVRLASLDIHTAKKVLFSENVPPLTSPLPHTVTFQAKLSTSFAFTFTITITISKNCH